MTDAVAAGGKSPVDVEMGASDPAGATLQAAFIVYADSVFLQSVNIGRANIKTGLLFTVINADRTVDDFQMRGFMYIKPV
jgi:hypothetical protein